MSWAEGGVSAVLCSQPFIRGSHLHPSLRAGHCEVGRRVLTFVEETFLPSSTKWGIQVWTASLIKAEHLRELNRLRDKSIRKLLRQASRGVSILVGLSLLVLWQWRSDCSSGLCKATFAATLICWGIALSFTAVFFAVATGIWILKFQSSRDS